MHKGPVAGSSKIEFRNLRAFTRVSGGLRERESDSEERVDDVQKAPVAGSPNIKFGDFQAVARAPGSLRRWESDGEERGDEGKEPEQHGLCEAIACSGGPTTREREVDGGGYWLRRI